MKYVVIYCREDSGTPLTILKDARIRQIGTSEELGLGLGKMFLYRLNASDMAMIITACLLIVHWRWRRYAKTKISNKDMG